MIVEKCSDVVFKNVVSRKQSFKNVVRTKSKGERKAIPENPRATLKKLKKSTSQKGEAVHKTTIAQTLHRAGREASDY